MESINILLVGVEDGSEFVKLYVNYPRLLEKQNNKKPLVFQWSMVTVLKLFNFNDASSVNPAMLWDFTDCF